jgi:hypothetical protein
MTALTQLIEKPFFFQFVSFPIFCISLFKKQLLTGLKCYLDFYSRCPREDFIYIRPFTVSLHISYLWTIVYDSKEENNSRIRE